MLANKKYLLRCLTMVKNKHVEEPEVEYEDDECRRDRASADDPEMEYEYDDSE